MPLPAMAIDLKHLLLWILVPVLFVVAGTFPFTPVMRTSCGLMWEASDLKLTCYFPEDLNATKKDFTVYRYKEGLANQSSPDVVLPCMWSEGKDFFCFPAPGYHFDGVIHPDHVNIRIRNATEQHSGKYVCHVPDYSDGVCYPPTKPPPQVYSSNRQKSTTTESPAGVHVSPGEHQTQRETSQEPDPFTAAAVNSLPDANEDSRQHKWRIITGSVVGPTAGVIVLIVIWFLVRRKCTRTPSNSNDEMQTMPDGRHLMNGSTPVQEQGGDNSDLI